MSDSRGNDSTRTDDALLTRPRQVSSDWHVSQAKALLAIDRGRELDNTLVYAAVELRAAIEREFMELLVLCRGKNELSDDELKRAQSQQGLEALLRDADSNYRATVEFTRIVMSLEHGALVIHQNHDPRKQGCSLNHDPRGSQDHDPGFWRDFLNHDPPPGAEILRIMTHPRP